MIDVKDVRVGNWVIKITGRDLNAKSFFEYKPIALDEYYYTFAKVCFPIKLSPGVLDKCGFTRESGEWFKSLTSDKKEDKGPFLKYKHENLMDGKTYDDYTLLFNSCSIQVKRGYLQRWVI